MAWTTKLDRDGNIHVRVEGYLDAEDGAASAKAIADLLGDRSRDLVIEAADMQGYRRGARTAWQEGLHPHRGYIRRVVMVGGNSVARMGGSVIAMYLGVPLMSVEAERTHDRAPDPDAPVRRPRARSSSRVITRPLSRPVLAAKRPPAKTKARTGSGEKRRRERSWGGLVLRRSREESRPNF